MSNPPFRRISVVIANHNYGRFVGAAVESALRIDWPDVEVVVVDDGSTDHSRAVLEGYADRVTVIHQDHATQRVARNLGYTKTSGEVVIHLDSDDVLRPGIGKALATVWRPGVSKVQMPMERIDADGVASGVMFPEFTRAPTPAQIRKWVHATGAYPTPPGSGNAYSREFLDRIFPLDESCGPATDSACLAAAPHFGDVITLTEPLVGYRVHGRNVSTLAGDPAKFPAAVERARSRHLYARRVSGQPPSVDESILRRDRHLLQLRVAALRLMPGRRTLAGDTFPGLFREALLSPFPPGPESMRARAMVMVWSMATLLAPAGLARRLVHLRFAQGPGAAHHLRTWVADVVARPTKWFR